MSPLSGKATESTADTRQTLSTPAEGEASNDPRGERTQRHSQARGQFQASTDTSSSARTPQAPALIGTLGLTQARLRAFKPASLQTSESAVPETSGDGPKLPALPGTSTLGLTADKFRNATLATPLSPTSATSSVLVPGPVPRDPKAEAATQVANAVLESWSRNDLMGFMQEIYGANSPAKEIESPYCTSSMHFLDAHQPSHRTEFENFGDFVNYKLQLINKYQRPYNPENLEAIPNAELEKATPEQIRDPAGQQVTLLDAKRPVDILGFRRQGGPLGGISEKIGVPFITTDASNCPVIYMGVTDEEGTKGEQALIHISSDNSNPIGAITAHLESMRERGLTRPQVIYATGASTEGLNNFMGMQAHMLADVLRREMPKLGFAQTFDQMGERRPANNDREANFGGRMTRAPGDGPEEERPIQFEQILRGVFTP